MHLLYKEPKGPLRAQLFSSPLPVSSHRTTYNLITVLWQFQRFKWALNWMETLFCTCSLKLFSLPSHGLTGEAFLIFETTIFFFFIPHTHQPFSNWWWLQYYLLGARGICNRNIHNHTCKVNSTSNNHACAIEFELSHLLDLTCR